MNTAREYNLCWDGGGGDIRKPIYERAYQLASEPNFVFIIISTF